MNWRKLLHMCNQTRVSWKRGECESSLDEYICPCCRHNIFENGLREYFPLISQIQTIRTLTFKEGEAKLKIDEYVFPINDNEHYTNSSVVACCVCNQILTNVNLCAMGYLYERFAGSKNKQDEDELKLKWLRVK